MEDKKSLILSSATQLFAIKGFYSTSVQQIAEHAKVSKGSIYLYFQSKDEILLSVFESHYSQVQLATEELEVLYRGDSKTILTKQIETLIQHMIHNKQFLRIYIRGDIFLQKEITQYLETMRLRGLQWYQGKLHDLYGEELDDYILDCSVMLEGLIFSYLNWVLLENSDSDSRYISECLVERLDFMIKGMLEAKSKPMFRADKLAKKKCSPSKASIEVKGWLLRATEELDHLNIKENERARIQNVLQALDNDLASGKPPTSENMLELLTQFSKLG